MKSKDERICNCIKRYSRRLRSYYWIFQTGDELQRNDGAIDKNQITEYILSEEELGS